MQCRPNINSNTGWRPILFCKFLWAAWFHDRLMPKYVPVRKSPMTIVLIRFRNDRVICGGAFVLIVHDRKPVETWSCACFLFSFAFVNRTVCESVFPAFFFRFFRFMRKTNPAVNAQLWSPTNTSAFKYFVNGFRSIKRRCYVDTCRDIQCSLLFNRPARQPRMGLARPPAAKQARSKLWRTWFSLCRAWPSQVCSWPLFSEHFPLKYLKYKTWRSLHRSHPDQQRTSR